MQFMKIEGTKEAFQHMIQETNVYRKLGVSKGTVSNWKAYLKAGNSISLDKMEEMLLKYGATVVKEKIWEFCKHKTNL